jgi:hypothetical protein
VEDFMGRVPLPLIALGAALMGCGRGDGPTSSGLVSEILILNGDTATVETLGNYQVRAIALNASSEEVTPGTFVWEYSSSDPSVASVNGAGLVTLFKNGTVDIAARVGMVADTVTLMVAQRATRVVIEPDTIVALTAGATQVGGQAIADTRMRIIARTADANGFPIQSPNAIVWSNLSPDLLTITSSARGDTLSVTGLLTGEGAVTATFADSVRTFPVQVADRYAGVRVAATGSGTSLNPTTVTVSARDAVVFIAADPSVIVGTGWEAGMIPAGLAEAQRFDVPGAYQYRAGSATGSIVVQP